MANRNTNKKHKALAWGIAQQNLDGTLTLVYTALGRQNVRDYKREMFPGGDYRTVQLDAVLIPYTK